MQCACAVSSSLACPTVPCFSLLSHKQPDVYSHGSEVEVTVLRDEILCSLVNIHSRFGKTLSVPWQHQFHPVNLCYAVVTEPLNEKTKRIYCLTFCYLTWYWRQLVRPKRQYIPITSLNDRMISGWWLRNDLERSVRGPICDIISSFSRWDSKSPCKIAVRVPDLRSKIKFWPGS